MDSIAILCPPLKNPAHGMVNVVSNRAGVGIAWYTCSPGYKRVGEPFRECLSDGQWSFKVPYCESKLSIKIFLPVSFTTHTMLTNSGTVSSPSQPWER